MRKITTLTRPPLTTKRWTFSSLALPLAMLSIVRVTCVTGAELTVEPDAAYDATYNPTVYGGYLQEIIKAVEDEDFFKGKRGGGHHKRQVSLTSPT